MEDLCTRFELTKFGRLHSCRNGQRQVLPDQVAPLSLSPDEVGGPSKHYDCVYGTEVTGFVGGFGENIERKVWKNFASVDGDSCGSRWLAFLEMHM
ncbi:hypothetical protein Bpfe_015180 [Biomphalaria pfeifferi]|uniref:Uncharacterized protein n=1 Tax=Biomphalaria pfeifferi TaxID=112525 RepID=A0AAD8BIT7_BIOPF|nr:hypothetical protein Bpfe_015180 [Biomphalaria pfeifferi]